MTILGQHGNQQQKTKDVDNPVISAYNKLSALIQPNVLKWMGLSKPASVAFSSVNNAKGVLELKLGEECNYWFYIYWCGD